MFSCTRKETQLIMQGQSCGVVRRYSDEGCPHEPGGEIVFTSQYLPWTCDNPSPVPFAKATVVSVRPGSVKKFKRDNEMAKRDGFANALDWYTHFSMMVYKGIGDDTPVHHVTFRLLEVDKGRGMEKTD